MPPGNFREQYRTHLTVMQDEKQESLGTCPKCSVCHWLKVVFRDVNHPRPFQLALRAPAREMSPSSQSLYVFRCVVFWGPLLAELSASLPIAQSCARARTWDALAPTDHLGALAAPGVVLTPPPSILNPPPKILTRPGLF